MIKKLLMRIRLPKESNWLFWIITIFLIKLIYFYFTIINETIFPIKGLWSYVAPDTLPYYFDPIDRFLESGSYVPDYRMPGYGVVYMVFRFFLDQVSALNTVLIFQIVLSSISVYTFGKLCKLLIEKEQMFYIGTGLLLFCSYTAIFDNKLAPESLTISSLIFSVYYFILYFKGGKSKKSLIISGLFFTWSFFLRPVYYPLLGLFVVYLLMEKELSVRNKLINVLNFTVIMFLLQGSWVVRNAIIYKQFKPLMTSTHYKAVEQTYYVDLLKFMYSWGGDFVYWNPKAEIRWFGFKEKYNILSDKNDKELPSYIYTSKFNRDSLVIIRDKIALLQSNSISMDSAEILDRYISDKFIMYRNSIIKEKPFLYYIGAPILLTKKFLIHSGTYNLFNEPFNKLSYIKKVTKLFYTFYYLAVIVSILFGVILLFYNKFKLDWFAFILFFGSYGVFVFPVGLRFIEYRYLVPIFPFLILIALLTLIHLVSIFNKYIVKYA